MIDLTIRTNSQDYKFRVPSTYTVLELKQHIAKQVNVAVIQQRFIYYGHDLDDETKLHDMDIDGKVLHLVQKLSTTAGTTPSTTTTTNNISVQNVEPGLRGWHDYEPRIAFLAIGIPSDLMHTIELSRLTSSSRNNGTVHCVSVGLEMIRRSNLVLNRLENLGIIDDELFEESSQQPEELSTSENRSAAITNDRRGFKELINQFNKLNARLQPFYTLYYQYIDEYVDLESIDVEVDNESQLIPAVFNGVSEVFHYLSHIYNIIGGLNIRFDRLPPRSIQCCSSAAQQATNTQITTANRSVPNVRASRPDFMNLEEAENETSNLSTSATQSDTHTENSNSSTEISPEIPHGVELLSDHTSGTSNIMTIDSIEEPLRGNEILNNMSMPIDWMDQTISSEGQLGHQRVINFPNTDAGLTGVGVESISPSNFVLGLEPSGDLVGQLTSPSPEQLLFTPIGNIPYFRDLEGRFILIDLFLLLARNWTFHDLLNLNIYDHQSSIVQNPVFRNAKHIVSFFLEKIMLNQPPTNSHIEEAANRIFLKMVPYLNVLVNKDCPESNGGNINASFLRCITHNLQLIVVFCDKSRILASNEIVNKLTIFAKEFLALVAFWCKGLTEFQFAIHKLLESLSLPTTLLDIVGFEFFLKVHQFWEIIATFQRLNLPMVHYFVYSNEPLVHQTSSVGNEDQTFPSSEVTNEPLVQPEGLIGLQESLIHPGSEWLPVRQHQRRQEIQPLYGNAYLSDMPNTQEDSNKP